jgi:ferredoxin
LAGLTPTASGVNSSPEVVVYESRGCVLVLGDDASAGVVAQRVAKQHPTVVFAPGVDAREWGAQVTAVGRKVTHLRGYLGAFEAEIHTDNEVTDVGAASFNPGRYFDLVLDLGAQALITDEVKPYGYFAPGPDEAKLSQAIASLSVLVGRFSKPRYFSYMPDLCAHGASGVSGCTRCLSVCSAQAISSLGNSVKVDPYLCQGCATCALSCPTGALTFKATDRQRLNDRLQAALTGSTRGVALVVHAQALDAKTESALSNDGAVLLRVDPLPAFGDELWLRALALGAGALVLLKGEDLPGKTQALLAERVGQMQTVMAAMGLNTECLALLTLGELPGWLASRDQWDTSGTEVVNVPILKSWARFKRLAWVDGLRQLGGHLASAAVDLPAGSAMGEVHVDSQRCTLCFACVNLCPTRALSGRHGTTQQLVFQESACVQCGLCVRGCPEQAVSLHARLALQAFGQMTSRVLHEDEQFKCTSCGTPFINRRMLASSLDRLKNHAVMAQGGREALMTCPSCRQREMLET